MKRTFLVIAMAVLVSTLFAPHKDHWNALDGVRRKKQGEAYYTTKKANFFDQFDEVKPQRIYVPAGHAMFDFPREMTSDQIRDALRKKFPGDKEIVFRAVTTKEIDEALAYSIAPAGKTFDPDKFFAKWDYSLPSSGRPLLQTRLG
jgi:hypothetical protein